MSDSPSENTEAERTRLMKLSGAERVLIGCEMFDAERRRVLASLPPGLTETERKRLLYKRIYGEELPANFFDQRPRP